MPYPPPLQWWSPQISFVSRNPTLLPPVSLTITITLHVPWQISYSSLRQQILVFLVDLHFVSLGSADPVPVIFLEEMSVTHNTFDVHIIIVTHIYPLAILSCFSRIFLLLHVALDDVYPWHTKNVILSLEVTLSFQIL